MGHCWIYLGNREFQEEKGEQSDFPCFQNSRLAARIRAGPPKIFSESSWSSQTTILAKTGSKEAANFMLDIVTRIEQIMIVSNGN